MTSHWLHRYGNNQHQWTEVGTGKNRVAFERQIGLVETSFDVDGIHYGGRADMTHYSEFEIKTSLNNDQLRERFILAWTVLRHHHVLMLARTADRREPELQRCFVVDVSLDPELAIAETKKTIAVVESNSEIDAHDFRHHALNTARIVDQAKSTTNVFILPITKLGQNRYKFPFLMVLAHMVSDGLTLFSWLGHFAGLDMPASSEWTRKTLHWNPTGPGLIEDLTNMKYS